MPVDIFSVSTDLASSISSAAPESQVTIAARCRSFYEPIKKEGANPNMRKNLIAVAIAMAITLGCASAAVAGAQGAMAKKSLYSRLGGKKAITAVVDEFVNIVANDGRINKFFADTAKDPKQLAKFKANLSDQICAGTGGPCKYKGKDMMTAHKGMGITDADFSALVEDLVAALNKFNVPETEKNELLGALGPMKPQIVGQ
jgi:hemoglobin